MPRRAMRRASFLAGAAAIMLGYKFDIGDRIPRRKTKWQPIPPGLVFPSDVYPAS